MANETKIGQLVIDLKIKTEALEKGLETAKKKLQQIEEENKNLKNSNKDLDASFIITSASIVASLMKIDGIIKDCANEYKSYTQAMSSLSDVADYTGQDLEDLGGIMNKFNSYMTQSDLATTIKNFSLMGFTAEQTEQMIEALTNSAIRNRNANYTVSEAVRVASEGYRQGLSTLSDSAGVTENLSVMLDNYAQSIGKTASQLTETEKNQAYLNRTMYAAQPFAGAMSDYMDSLAGKEGQYSQALRETQVAYTEALEPTLVKITEMKTNLIKLLGDLINNNNSATKVITAFIATLLTATVIVTGTTTAIKLYRKAVVEATASTKAFKIAIGGIFAVSAVVGIITAITSAQEELEEAQKRVREEQELYNQVMSNSITVTDENINKVKEMATEFENYRTAILNAKEAIISLDSNVDTTAEKALKLLTTMDEIVTLVAGSSVLKTTFGIENMDELEESIESCNDEIEKYNLQKEISNNIDLESARNKKKEASQAVETAKEYQRLFDIYKKGEKGTKEYEDAVNTLSKAFPEAVSATGILDEEMQAFINNTADNAKTSWNDTQNSIQTTIDNINKAIAYCSPEVDPNGTYKASLAQQIRVPTDEVIGKLQGLITLFNVLKGVNSDQIGGVSIPKTTTTRSSGSSSYSNKALDNYKKEIAHKKALDQLSIQQEISMYEYALKRYAKTTDEKRELRETIYELNKELAQKEKDILDQQTEDYENYMQDVKNARDAAYDVTEQTADYNKIIQMHKNYLNQIMKDERLSLDERKEIYREELNTIRDYEQKKRDLRVEQIDSTVTQLTNAITKQLEEMQAKDKEAIDKNLEEVEKWKEARINAINEEYDSRIEAIEKELEALDKVEQQKSRDEEDAEYERKKNRLQQLIDYEHDATTKANYQKELDKLVAEYQKTLDSRALEDKKEALNAQKELLKDEQNDKTQAIEDEVEKQKELYNNQLDELEKYYDEQINKAQETAEKMLLNVEQNQDKILGLLKDYGDAYEITGQTLGEKLAQGINEGLTSKIENIIARIQSSIDASIEAQISKIASSTYKYEEGTNKPQAKTQNITINQTNNIEQNPELPSETYRKLRNIDEELAASLAGI